MLRLMPESYPRYGLEILSHGDAQSCFLLYAQILVQQRHAQKKFTVEVPDLSCPC
jgi:hypothetical protein